MSSWIQGVQGYRDEKYKTLFRETCLSESTCTTMDAIPAANNQTYTLNIGGCETWELTDAQKDEIKPQLETAFNLKLTITYGSIKRWFRPSQIHTDGVSADYDYSVIIPTSFTQWSDSVRPPASDAAASWSSIPVSDHGDHKAPNADDGPGAFLHSTITGTPSVSIDSDGIYHQNNFGVKKDGVTYPQFGPGFVIYDAEWNENVIFMDRVESSTRTGKTIKNNLTGIPTQVKNKEGATSGLGVHSSRIISHVAEKFRVIPIRHYMPWSIGSAIAFKPELLHSSTNWLPVGKYKSHLFMMVKINAGE